MNNAKDRFSRLLYKTLIPDFCANKGGTFEPAGFRGGVDRLSEIDMADFIRGWESDLLVPIGGGLYRATQSGAAEKFFWSGFKGLSPRTFTIWIEPVITLAVLARMHLDFHWPKELIATQSKHDWAFDVVGFRDTSLAEHLACEVKKSRKELDQLIANMQFFGQNPTVTGDKLSGAKRNAFNKLAALRARKPIIFWAVGPDRYEMPFQATYSEDGRVDFAPTTLQSIFYPMPNAEQ